MVNQTISFPTAQEYFAWIRGPGRNVRLIAVNQFKVNMPGGGPGTTIVATFE